MKRLAIAAIAAATFAAPLIAATDAAAQSRGHHRGDRGDHRGDRSDRGDRHDNYRRDGRRDHRRADRWDDRRHNGYYRNNRWYYGPPPSQWRDSVRYDYRGWRRGQRLTPYFRHRYRAVDWRYAHLRRPPRGYHYVRDDRGDYLLVGIATGVILSVILSNY